MDIIYKYRIGTEEYLVYDRSANQTDISDRMIRTMCAQNFGLGMAGVIVGSVFSEGRAEMSLYSPEGETMDMDEDIYRIFQAYLKDAGYTKAVSRSRISRRQADIQVSCTGRCYVYMDLGHAQDQITNVA